LRWIKFPAEVQEGYRTKKNKCEFGTYARIYHNGESKKTSVPFSFAAPAVPVLEEAEGALAGAKQEVFDGCRKSLWLFLAPWITPECLEVSIDFNSAISRKYD